MRARRDAAVTIEAVDGGARRTGRRRAGDFYRRLLGWTVDAAEPDWVKISGPDGGAALSFQTESGYRRPTWPAGPGDQQMMVHLDIQVDDLEASGAHAIA